MIDLNIRLGALPWLPDPEGELVETFLYYDRPLIGVVRSGDTFTLFECVDGHIDDQSLWKYVQLDDEELEMLRVTDDFDESLHSITDDREGVLAFADTGGILRYDTPLSMRPVDLAAKEIVGGSERFPVGLLLASLDDLVDFGDFVTLNKGVSTKTVGTMSIESMSEPEWRERAAWRPLRASA